MKLIQLRYFQKVCELGSTAAAAEEMFVSQPTISSSVINLEKEFGIPLFSRKGKRLILTEEGQTLLDLAADLLHQEDTIREVMKNLVERRNLIRLGIPPMLSALLLPKIYRDFHNIYPEVQIQITEESIQQLYKRLNNRENDLIIASFHDLLTQRSSFYNYWHITELKYAYCVGKDHPLAGRKTITIPEIEGYPLITFGKDSNQRKYTFRQFELYGKTPNVVYSATQLSTILEMISVSGMSAFLYQNLILPRNDLCFIPLDPPVNIEIDIVWLKNKRLFRDCDKLVRFLQHNL